MIKKFNLKRYVWLIILVVSLILYVVAYSQVTSRTDLIFGFSMGAITGRFVDGFAIGIITWVISTKVLKKRPWKMYEFLNFVAYAAVTTKIILEVIKNY